MTLSAWFRTMSTSRLAEIDLALWKTAQKSLACLFTLRCLGWRQLDLHSVGSVARSFSVVGATESSEPCIVAMSSGNPDCLCNPDRARRLGSVPRGLSLEHALAFLGRMFGIVGSGPQLLPLTQFTSMPMSILIVAASFLALPLWPTIKPVWPSITEKGSGLGDVLSAGYVGTVMVLSLATMAANQQNPFLYFRF